MTEKEKQEIAAVESDKGPEGDATPSTIQHFQDPEDDAARRGMSNAVQNVIALYGFLAVLAIHNCLREFVSAQPIADENGQFVSAFVAEPVQWLAFLLALIFAFRYYLGDLMFLRKYEEKNHKFLVADAINVLLNATLIAYMSFFVRHPSELFKLMFLIMCIDIVWLFVGRLTKRDQKRRAEIDESIDISIWVSVFTVAVMFFVTLAREVNWEEIADLNIWQSIWNVAEQVVAGPFDELTVWLLLGAMALDTLLDMYVRGPSYLGRGEAKLVRKH